MKDKIKLFIIIFTAILSSKLTPNLQAQNANTWTQKSNFGGTARNGAVGFSIGSKAYMGTGFIGGTTDKDDFWEYNPANNTWAQKANFPGGPREGAVGFSIGNKGYVGTGWNLGTYYKDFWEYNPSNNTWTQRPNFGGIAREAAVGFCIGNKGYIGTGNDANGTNYKDFWEYDPANNIWTQKANFGGVAREFAVGIGGSNVGYIGLGYGAGYKNDFWEYNPSNNTWTQKTNFGGTGRAGAVGFFNGVKCYVGGGFNGNPSNDFWEYDPGSDNWAQKADFGGLARTSAVGINIGYKGYIGTGSGNSVYYNDFWEYNPPSSIATSTPSTYNCAPGSLSIPFVAIGTFNSGNIFTAQLSDNNGSFNNPTNIGSITATTSGTINANISGGLLTGTAYRVRVISSNPSITGSDNGINISITPTVVPSVFINVLPSTSVCEGSTVTFTAVPSNEGGSPNYEWYLNNNPVGNNTNSFITSGLSNNDSISVVLTSSLICVIPQIAISQNVNMVLHTPPASPVISLVNDTLLSSETVGNQWYLNGNVISNATSQTYLPTQNGKYYVVITDANGCFSDTSNNITYINSGISELENSMISIYPNPAVDHLTVESNGRNIDEIKIYNATGNLVSETRQPQSKFVDISRLSNGIYIAEIIGKDVVVRKRWVKM